jgi:integrase
MATKRADGRWQEQLTITENGQRKQKYFYGKTKAEVLRKIAAYKEEAAQGPLFSVVAEQWLEEAERTLAHNSFRGYLAAYRRAVAYFGATPITSIQPIHLRQFLDNFTEANVPSKSTARTQRQVLCNIFGRAFDKGILQTNPVIGLKLKKGLPETHRTLPSDAEIKLIQENWDKPFGMFAYWILYTGLRRGELLALTWEDIDFKNGTISVNKSLYYRSGRPEIKRPKTAKGERVVPLMSALRKRLVPGKGIIFHDEDGGHIGEMRFISLWGKYAQQSGVNCTPHQLRHAFATMLFDNDIEAKDAQDILGHAYLATTQDVYTHIREERRKKIRDKLIDVDFAFDTEK